MQKHIQESGESTFVVNAVMNVKTLVLRVNESVSDMLRYSVDRNGNTLDIGFEFSQYNGLSLSVFVYFRTVQISIASRFKLGKSDGGGLVHKVHYINCKSGGNDSTRNDNNEKKRQQSSGNTRKKFFQNNQKNIFLFLRMFFLLVRILTAVRLPQKLLIMI